MLNGDNDQSSGSITPIMDETLVMDARDGLCPAEMVQNRLWEIEGKLPFVRREVIGQSAGRRPAQGT